MELTVTSGSWAPQAGSFGSGGQRLRRGIGTHRGRLIAVVDPQRHQSPPAHVTRRKTRQE